MRHYPVKRWWFELGAWLSLGLIALLLVLNSGRLYRLFGEQMPGVRDLNPYSVVEISQTVARSCATASLAEKREASILPSLRYDPRYNTLIDQARVEVYRIEDGAVLTSEGVSSEFARCLERGLQAQLTSDAINAKALWIRLFVRSDNLEILAIKPAVKLGQGMRVSDQPWYPKRIIEGGVGSGQTGTKKIYQTLSHRDVLTGESISSILYRETAASKEGGPLEVSAVVDVRSGPFPSTFHFVIFLNFVSLLIFSGINAVMARQLEADFAYSWYWAWLCWALMYGLYATVYLLRVPLLVIDTHRFQMLTAIPVLSIANDAFFALAALEMLGKGGRFRQYIIWSVAVGSCLVFFAVRQLEGSGVVAVGGSRWVDATLSFGVTVLLARAFLKEIREKYVAITGPEPFSVPAGKAIVGSFFVLFGLHQLQLAATTSSPLLEQLFWLFSLIMKIGLASLFYIIMLKSRYREESEVGSIVFERMERGVVAVASDLAVIAINGAAAKSLGVSPTEVVGKDVRAVAFRSLFESERLLDDIARNSLIAPRMMLMKQYSGSFPGPFRDIDRLIGAQKVKDSEVDRVYALLYIGAEEASPAK